MKQFITFIVIFLLGASSIISQTETLTVLYLNDTHSCLAPLGPRTADLQGTVGGIARAASVIGSYEMGSGNVLTLHSGDFCIGDLFYNKYFGVPELQILNQVGLDAMTVGNHEFDLGPTTLETALTAAFGNPSTGFPLLSANADLSAYPGNLSTYIKSYTIKNFGDLKVGIFGLTTHETNMLSNPSPVVIDDDFLTTAGIMVQTLKVVEGCDFVICLSHYGTLGDQALATYVPGIDLIVGGHDHIPVPPTKIGDTWLVQGFSQYQAIGKLDFEISSTSIVLAGSEIIKLDASIPENPAIAGIVTGLIAGIEALYGPVYSQQIGNSNQFMEEYAANTNKPGNHSTSCGNFISDAMVWKTGTDLAIEPGGSIAMPIYQGPIVPADLFRTVGYGFNTQNGLGFRLLTASISGYELYRAMEILLTFLDNEDFFPQFSGLTLRYMPYAPEGERVSSIKINGKTLNPTQMYTFTSNELVPKMLDLFGIIYQDVVIMDNYTEFQNLCAYTEYLGGKIKAGNQARVIGVGYDEEDQVMSNVLPVNGKMQNYPNPFNPSTVITFSIPIDGIVKLTVYNTIGEEVTVLSNEYKTAGEYQVQWQAANCPAGVYFYNIQSTGYNETKKMLLLK